MAYRTLSKHCLSGLMCLFMLGACSTVGDVFDSNEKDAPLEGERISILQLQKELEPSDASLERIGFAPPEAWQNSFWPQAGGYPNHAMQHLVLEKDLERVWSTDIGSGSSKNLPLTAQPILVDNRIFTLDTESQVSAFDIRNGDLLWRVDVRDTAEEGDPVIGGGLSYSSGRIYVTGGYDEVVALHPQSGDIIWRSDIPTPARAAPTAIAGRLFITGLDNRLFALAESDGRILWQYQGLTESTGLLGAASPAANQDIVVPAMSSGEIYAVQIENGSIAWADNLSPVRRVGALAGLSDIRGLPVIDRGLVFAISFGRKLVAVDIRTGTRVWQQDIGGSETPWVSGNMLFVVTSDNQLVGLSRDNGAISWVTQLPRYEDEADKEGPIIWTGPLLASNRLILASSDGEIIEADPETGAIFKRWASGQNVTIAPIIAGGALFMLSDDGTLAVYK